MKPINYQNDLIEIYGNHKAKFTLSLKQSY